MGTDQKCSKWFLEFKKSVVNFFPPYSQSLGVVWSSYLVGIGLYTSFIEKKLWVEHFNSLSTFSIGFHTQLLSDLSKSRPKSQSYTAPDQKTRPFYDDQNTKTQDFFFKY